MGYDRAIASPGVTTKQVTFAQLTAAGLTAAEGVDGMRHHTLQVKIASINTNVVVDFQGSLDGTNYFRLPLALTSQSALSISNNQATITSNGTYSLNVINVPLKYVKGNFVSESGGTNATVDMVYLGST